MAIRTGGALRRPRREGARLLDRRSLPGFGTEGAARDDTPLRLPQVGLADRLLLDHLRGTGLVEAADLIEVQSTHLRSGDPVLGQLVAKGFRAQDLLALSADAGGTEYLSGPLVADPSLVDQLGLQTCLSRDIAPLRRAGGVVVLATSRPSETLRAARLINRRIGPFRMVLAPDEQVSAAILDQRRNALAEQAQASVSAEQSCRSLGAPRLATGLKLALIFFATLGLLAPRPLFAVLTALAVLLLAATTGLKLWTLKAALTKHASPPSPPNKPAAQTPFISLLVPLLREERIARRLIQRLEALDYPRHRMEVLLIVEESDQLTRRAVEAADLPAWFRVVIVPRGPVQTKPRALNYALAQARGTIIGVYDAEDAPEPDQLSCVVKGFASAPADLVCLQGALDFYNPRQSILTRLFTLDYAAWFRVTLPGLAKLGLVLPLGGTTLFFRRPALEALGGWDAWNVTEDADLGLRLARRGWKTGLIPSTTYEEAVSAPLPWIRQRSRWIKGYAMTWACHMRAPRVLWRDLGPRRFWAMQLMFLAPVAQPLLAPFLWSFWLLALGLPHPLAEGLGLFIWPLIALFLLCEVVTLVTALMALRATHHRMLGLWVPLLQVYGWLATFAAWKAVLELVRRPFFWDKTAHGHSCQGLSASIRRASTRSLVS